MKKRNFIYLLTIMLILVFSSCKKEEPPKADFDMIYTIDDVLPRLYVKFDNKSKDATFFIWDFGDGNTSKEENPEHIFVNESDSVVTYTVTLTAKSKGGSDVKTKTIDVKPANNNPCECNDPTVVSLPTVPIDSTLLLGKWELCKYVDLQTFTSTTIPDNITKSVSINFIDFNTVYGYSLCNDIWGKYELVADSIKLIDVWQTIIYCPSLEEEENKFFSAFYNVDLIKVEENILFLFYYQSKRVMLFKKLS